MKRLITILAFAALTTALPAKKIDQVDGKNGAVYEGYISEQVPGEYISVKTETTTIVVESARVDKIQYTKTNVETLSVPMREWIQLNKPGTTTVDLATLSVAGRNYTDVIMLESGSGVKFVSFENTEYKLSWQDIVKTTRTDNGKDAKAGIEDVVTLQNGKYLRGFIVEQVIGGELKIRTDDDVVNVVKNEDVLCINSEQIDKKRSLWSQIQFLDRLELKNGECVEGFIVSRLFGKYVALATQGSAVDRYVQLGDIAKYVKKHNPDYEEYDYTSETVEEPKEEVKEPVKTMDEIIAGITINDKAVIPSASEHIGQLYVLPNGTENVFRGKQVRVNIPIEETSTSLRIVRLKKRRIMVTTHQVYDGVNSFWSFIEEYNMLPTRNYYISAIDKNHVEVTVYGLKPGYYMILPFVGSDKCAAFEIRKK